ncbi:SLC13 family permease [Alteromonas oceanisediminis]|uniref:SLC13 family permease n=1 Tax=Alteromonas oceanisediminis TaxID=2836180 RepID=UPI001BD99375|nr:SLC13 family permease [Alteromonas oceanisediminis]MBT0587268.1 SLC13 family permease [Alteromonas oceanisediminis]
MTALPQTQVKPAMLGVATGASVVMFVCLTVMDQPYDIAVTAAITLLVAIMWVTEALPIPVSSLVPFFAFPLAGVLTHREAAAALGSHVILLLMGAFMLSKALEKSGVHERLAYSMLRLTGAQSAKRLVLAFMLTAAFLSMWISNTATALMLMPIALALIAKLGDARLATVLLLGIAYAASLGGVGTPIGTPPNIIFMSVYEEFTGQQVSFVEWMKTGVPIVFIAIPLMALWLTRGLGSLPALSIPVMGRWRSAEKRVFIAFAAVAMAWVLRPQWTALLGVEGVSDSTVALAGVVLMCIIPSGGSQSKKDYLLDWDTARDIPWGMLLLFAGGICIASAFKASGLSQVLGDALSGLTVLPIFLLVLGLCLAVSFLTEITSNTATATLLMPILASAALANQIDPRLLMIPAAISASCAFMLPVATAPNAIVYGTGKISIQQMAKEGAMLNVMVGVVVACVIAMQY